MLNRVGTTTAWDAVQEHGHDSRLSMVIILLDLLGYHQRGDWFLRDKACAAVLRLRKGMAVTKE